MMDKDYVKGILGHLAYKDFDEEMQEVESLLSDPTALEWEILYDALRLSIASRHTFHSETRTDELDRAVFRLLEKWWAQVEEVERDEASTK